MGFTELLTIIFILAKIFGVIDWNLFLVLLPELFAIVVYLIFILIAFYSNKIIEKNFDKFWGDK